MGGKHLNKPVLGMERTATGKGYWLFASDGGIFSFGDAQFYGSLGATKLTSPVVSMQRTATGKGYWMMTKDGRMFRFGDAKAYGDTGACKNYGGAARMLVTPFGHGYWIATGNGNIVAFGDAKNLGFPATVGGPTIALIGPTEISDSHRAYGNTRGGRRVKLMSGNNTPTGSSGDTGLRGWHAHDAPCHRPLEPAPGNAGGGRDARDTRRHRARRGRPGRESRP